MQSPKRAFLNGIFIAGLVVVAVPRLAWTQCDISGPDVICGGGSIQLCAPPGGFYEWWGEGLVSDQQCVTISQPGTYFLSWYDPNTGQWFGPCSRTVTVGEPPTASISGPSTACPGQPAELCGPDGSFLYSWSGPAGFTSSSRCVSASAAGDYQLVVTPAGGGCPSAPVTHSLTVGVPPTASISGPTVGCDNQAAELCGPEGGYVYWWSGPAGFTASTRCVSVSAGGIYQLVIASAAGGCPSAPASHELDLMACPTDPPPPPDNCPRPPSWWLRQCNVSYNRALSMTSVEAVAARVDQESPALDFSGDQTFCRTMAQRFNIRARAKRHLAAVHANICAGEMGLEMLRGPAVRLSRSTQVSLPGVSGTVGEWLDAANQKMMTLESQSLLSLDVRRQYAEVIRIGWMIDHGRGIGTICTNDGAKMLPEDTSPALDMADGIASLELQVFPTAGSADVEFAVSSENSEDVSIGVYDVAGRRVAELARGAYAPGIYRVRWDAKSGSGVYFVRGRIADQAFTQSRVAIVR